MVGGLTDRGTGTGGNPDGSHHHHTDRHEFEIPNGHDTGSLTGAIRKSPDSVPTSGRHAKGIAVSAAA